MTHSFAGSQTGVYCLRGRKTQFPAHVLKLNYVHLMIIYLSTYKFFHPRKKAVDLIFYLGKKFRTFHPRTYQVIDFGQAIFILRDDWEKNEIF